MTGSIRGRFQRHPNSAMQPGMDQTPAIHSSLAPQLHSSTNDQLLCTTRWEKAAVDLVRCPPWSQGHLSSQEILLGVKLALQMLCVAAERQSSFNGLRVGPGRWRRSTQGSLQKERQGREESDSMKIKCYSEGNSSLDVRGEASNGKM